MIVHDHIVTSQNHKKQNTYYINKDRDMSTGYVKVDDSATDPSADKLERDCTIFQKKETILPQILLEVC